VLSSTAMDLPVPDTEPCLQAVTTPAYAVLAPGDQRVPLVFASPHSGRAYPAEFIAAARLDPHALRRSEDSFVEALFDAAPRHGAPLLHALFPRAWCDANREPWELDPAMFDEALPEYVNAASPRVGAGLGTIARVVATGETIYRRKLSFAEAEARIAACWQPYHDALEALIAATRARFGLCLLVDCHSMPTLPGERRARQPDIVLGDAHGTSASPVAMRRLEDAMLEAGFTVRRNDPYAGGFVTRHYGRPREGVHAVQIEIARALYMDEDSISRHGGFEAMRSRIEGVIASLVSEDWSMLRRG
jgi:N-formylglutamate amidohydrolase